MIKLIVTIKEPNSSVDKSFILVDKKLLTRVWIGTAYLRNRISTSFYFNLNDMMNRAANDPKYTYMFIRENDFEVLYA